MNELHEKLIDAAETAYNQIKEIIEDHHCPIEDCFPAAIGRCVIIDGTIYQMYVDITVKKVTGV